MGIFDKYPALLDAEFIEGFDFGSCWTVENPTEGVSDYDLAAAIIAAKGNLTVVSRMLRRPRRVIDRYISNDIALFDLTRDLESEFIDEIEEVYRVIARAGDGQAIRFFLSTKGKDRGYNQRSEISGANGGPIQTEEVAHDAAAFARRIAALAAKHGTGEADE